MADDIRDLIMVAPTGARRQKADHPAMPLSVAEIAATARACQISGAGALHLHVRDRAGQHTLDAGLYGEAMAAVARTAPGMGIQITTESAGIFAPAEQLACLEAVRPERASIALREMAQDLNCAVRTYARCGEIGTRVQHILYSPEDIARLLAWRAQGIVPAGPLEVIFVLGRYAPATDARQGDLEAFLAAPGAGRLDWTACAFGRDERACLLSALARGGKARVGFENNIHHPDGRRLADNAQSVRLLVEAALAARVLEQG